MDNLTLNQMTQKDNDNTQIIETDVPSYDDTLSLRVIDELLNLSKVKTISRIKPEQITNLVKLFLFSETFKAPFCQNLANHILQLQISLNGLGRQELVQLVQQRNNAFIEKPLTSNGVFK
jgi:hypothetical protein